MNYKRLLCGLLLAIGVVINLEAAQKPVATGAAPSWVMKTQFRDRATPEAKNNASDGYLYLLNDVQVHVGEKTRYQHFTRKIVTKSGVQYGSEIGVQFDPDYEQLVFHHINIHRDGQTLNRLQPKEFKVLQQENERERFIYNNNRTAVITLADVREGDVIDYSFSVKGYNPIHPKYADNFRLNGPEELDLMLVRVLSPANRPLRHKVFNSKQKPQVLQHPGLVEYRWLANQVPGRSPEDNLPSWYSPYAFLSFTEYASWEEVNNWAQTLYTRPVGKSAKLQEKIAEIKQKDGSDEERLAAALKFVQNEVRYLGNEGGIYGYQPNDPAVVFTRRYGDCKDKALLLCHMLGQMNIKAWPVLVNTDMRQQLANELPSPYAFDHCVVKVELLNKTVWYDATLSQQEGAYDNIHFPNYALGLVIAPGSNALSKLPKSENAKVEITDEYMLGGLEEEVFFNVKTSLTGAEADQSRSYFASTGHQEIEKNYLNFYASLFPAIKTENELLVNDLPGDNLFTTFENYRIPDFWLKSEEKKEPVWTAEIYPLTLQSKLQLPATKIRTMPLALDYPYTYEHTIKIHLPANWDIKESEKEIKDNSIYYKQVTKYDAAQRMITLHYSFKTLKNHVPVEEMKSYFANVKKIQDNYGFILTRADPALATGIMDGGANWLAVTLLLVLLAVGGYGGYRLYQYDPAPELGYQQYPREIGGWLMLVLVGMVLSCLIIFIGSFKLDFFSAAVWSRFGDPDSTFYNPVHKWVLALSFVYNMLLFCFATFVCVLFFQKRSSLPRFIILYYAISVVGKVVDLAVASALGGDITQWGSGLVGPCIAAAIWIPYFYKSRRVKETFLVQLHPGVVEEEEKDPLAWLDEPTEAPEKAFAGD